MQIIDKYGHKSYQLLIKFQIVDCYNLLQIIECWKEPRGI